MMVLARRTSGRSRKRSAITRSAHSSRTSAGTASRSSRTALRTRRLSRFRSALLMRGALRPRRRCDPRRPREGRRSRSTRPPRGARRRNGRSSASPCQTSMDKPSCDRAPRRRRSRSLSSVPTRAIPPHVGATERPPASRRSSAAAASNASASIAQPFQASAERAATCDHLCGSASDPEFRLLRREERPGDRRNMRASRPGLAAEERRAGRPAVSSRIATRSDGGGEGDPEGLVLGLRYRIARAEPQDGPPPAHLIQGRRLLRQDPGRPERGPRHEGPDVEIRMERGDGCEDRRRARARVDPAPRGEQVIGREHAVVSGGGRPRRGRRAAAPRRP